MPIQVIIYCRVSVGISIDRGCGGARIYEKKGWGLAMRTERLLCSMSVWGGGGRREETAGHLERDVLLPSVGSSSIADQLSKKGRGLSAFDSGSKPRSLSSGNVTYKIFNYYLLSLVSLARNSIAVARGMVVGNESLT